MLPESCRKSTLSIKHWGLIVVTCLLHILVIQRAACFDRVARTEAASLVVLQ